MATVLCFDSGIGGLAYLEELQSTVPQVENWLYLADNAYFPFGEKDQTALRWHICEVIAAVLQRYPADIVVLLCNTATVLALDSLRQCLPQQQFVGTVPAIKPAASASQRRKIAMLASKSTSQAAYVADLHRRFGADCRLQGINAAALIRFIEQEWPMLAVVPHEISHGTPSRQEIILKSIETAVAPCVAPVLASGADQVVLGCTHFLHLRNQLQEAFQAVDPEIGLCDSRRGVGMRLRSLLHRENLTGRMQKKDLSAMTEKQNISAKKNILLLTRKLDAAEIPRWNFWTQHFAMELRFLTS